MPHEISVREATVEDADAIARVHVLTWQSAYRDQIPDDFLDAIALPQREQVWRRLLAVPARDETNWVALAGTEVVGFAGAGASRDEDADERTGELFAIYVMAERWGGGAGPALMRQAERFLRERFYDATLWVLAGNARARRFYEKFGWRFDGTTKDDDRGSFVLHEVRYRIDLGGKA